MCYYWLLCLFQNHNFQSLSSFLYTSQNIYLIFCLTESVILFQLLIVFLCILSTFQTSARYRYVLNTYQYLVYCFKSNLFGMYTSPLLYRTTKTNIFGDFIASPTFHYSRSLHIIYCLGYSIYSTTPLRTGAKYQVRIKILTHRKQQTNKKEGSANIHNNKNNRNIISSNKNNNKNYNNNNNTSNKI